MRRLRSLALCLVLFGLGVAPAPAVLMTVDVWTGELPTGWDGGVTPATGDSIYLGRAVNRTVTIAGSINLNTLFFGPDEDQYYLDATTPVTLGLSSGLIAVDSSSGRLVIQPNVTIALSGTAAFDAGNNTIVVYNKVTGTAAPTFLGTGGSGAFLFVNSTGTNDYVGNTTVGDGIYAAPTISFWNGSPFGTGTVTFANGGTLVAHNTQTVANNLVLNAAGATNMFLLRTWDAPLTFSGSVTLDNSAVISVQASPASYTFANGAGNVGIPGQATRPPVIFTGAIGQSGGARNLTINNQGLVILQPTSGSNTYTGGTSVNGSLIFGNNGAVPATGTIQVNNSGYAGFGDLTPGNFNTQVLAGTFSKTSDGAIGVDALTGSTVTYAESINLSTTGGNGTTPLGFASGSAIRLGAATGAILTGSLTPAGLNYQFGNGGGTLTVQSALGDTAGNGVNAVRGVMLNNTSFVPLTLNLRGANTYTGGTTVSTGGILIFDGAGAVPASGALTAGGSNTILGNSYVGFSDNVLGSAPTTALTSNLNLFDKAGTWGVVGFDSASVGSPITINNLSLAGFNDGVFVGTASAAILTGTVTPTSVASPGNAANTLRLTAANGGTLTVTSALVDAGPALALMLGAPGTGTYAQYANGRVILASANSYSGGTTLNANAQGLTVGVNSNSAFGTGAVSIVAPVGTSSLVGLEAMSPGINLPNSFAFANSTSLFVQGDNSLTLSGALSGSGIVQLQRLTTGTPGNLTLAGNNVALDGEIRVQNSTLTLTHNNAAGQANVELFDAAATVAFGGGATAPKLYGIGADSGHLVLPNATGTVLTFQLDDDTNHDGDFGGVISGVGGAATDAALVVTASNNVSNDLLYLHGHNLYSGGTTISGYGGLGLGYSDSAGSGPITIAATDGGLILNTGVTLTNALVFNSGGLAGLGAFAPTAVSGTGQTAGKITFGANQILYAGIPGGDLHIPGVLTIQTNVAFAAGGSLREMIANPTLANTLTGSPATNINGGYSLVSVQGNLDLTLLAISSFLVEPVSIDATHHKGVSSFIVAGQVYVIPILATTGTITGFNAADFTFDASAFQDGLTPASAFTITADASHLYLNFTAVPEPSTWLLLSGGLALLGLRRLRRTG